MPLRERAQWNRFRFLLEGWMGDRGWARALLSWRASGPQRLEAEISRVRYVIRAEAYEIIAHAEIRDLAGRRRCDIGSFRTVGAARAACERDAVARCRREREERGAVDVRIAPRRRRRSSVANGNAVRESTRPADAYAALDAALAALAGLVEEEG